ncbi:ATP-binding cassette domain-containing protein [Nocardia sp. NPDC050175]|uniref:ABC transporter ATP-binding protein n=1 Tax=Nocardia sp. NPDC050175 TaxID=3364317 RepID=UPI0037B81842
MPSPSPSAASTTSAAAATRLQREFAEFFGVETIEKFLDASFNQFASRATVLNFLPLLAERFARQRLQALVRVEGKALTGKPIVLFVCVHNAGRSQMDGRGAEWVSVRGEDICTRQDRIVGSTHSLRALRSVVEVRNESESDAVVFTGVTKSYGAVRAVCGLDLRLARGRTVALLGPNGAGKSTVIGMLLGLIPPDGGTISVLGATPERAVREGRIGAVPQSGRLIPGVTVRELVGFVHRTYARRRPVGSLAELMDTAQITELAGRRADRLSGGQAQRVRLAIAVAGAPDLIILDEPTTGLDIESRRELWANIRSYAERGTTVLFSTHYLDEADDHADRIVVIDRGRVIAEGTSEQIKERVPGRRVSIEFTSPAPALDALPGVVGSETRGSRVHLHTTDADATVQALAEAGLLRNLEVVGAGLEEAFLALTSMAADKEAIR